MTNPPLDLDAIKARYTAASPEPWEVCQFDSGHSRFEMSVSVVAKHNGDSIADMDGLARSHNEDPRYQDDGQHDAAFIAHAHEDVPALVAEVERMRADLVEWEETLAPLWVDRHEAEKQQLRDEIKALLKWKGMAEAYGAQVISGTLPEDYERKITSLTASLEVVDRRLTEKGYAPEDQIRSARLHIKAALEGKARPLDYQNDQLRQAQAIITEAKREAELWPGSDVEAQAGAALQRVSIALSRTDTSTYDAAIEAAKAKGWDECLDAIDENELNTDQARAGNPYRASIEQPEADRG